MTKVDRTENSYLAEKLDELERFLGQERVLTQKKASVGHLEGALVVITHKTGNKWTRFGFVKKGITYVSPHEALFLVEQVRQRAL